MLEAHVHLAEGHASRATSKVYINHGMSECRRGLLAIIAALEKSPGGMRR